MQNQFTSPFGRNNTTNTFSLATNKFLQTTQQNQQPQQQQQSLNFFANQQPQNQQPQQNNFMRTSTAQPSSNQTFALGGGGTGFPPASNQQQTTQFNFMSNQQAQNGTSLKWPSTNLGGVNNSAQQKPNFQFGANPTSNPVQNTKPFVFPNTTSFGNPQQPQQNQASSFNMGFNTGVNTTSFGQPTLNFNRQATNLSSASNQSNMKLAGNLSVSPSKTFGLQNSTPVKQNTMTSGFQQPAFNIPQNQTTSFANTSGFQNNTLNFNRQPTSTTSFVTTQPQAQPYTTSYRPTTTTSAFPITTSTFQQQPINFNSQQPTFAQQQQQLQYQQPLTLYSQQQQQQPSTFSLLGSYSYLTNNPQTMYSQLDAMLQIPYLTDINKIQNLELRKATILNMLSNSSFTSQPQQIQMSNLDREVQQFMNLVQLYQEQESVKRVINRKNDEFTKRSILSRNNPLQNAKMSTLNKQTVDMTRQLYQEISAQKQLLKKAQQHMDQLEKDSKDYNKEAKETQRLFDLTKINKDVCIKDIATVEQVCDYLAQTVMNYQNDFKELMDYVNSNSQRYYHNVRGGIIDVKVGDVSQMLQIIKERILSNKSLIENFQNNVEIMKKEQEDRANKDELTTYEKIKMAEETAEMLKDKSMKLLNQMAELDDQLTLAKENYLELELQNQAMREEKGLDTKDINQIRHQLKQETINMKNSLQLQRGGGISRDWSQPNFISDDSLLPIQQMSRSQHVRFNTGTSVDDLGKQMRKSLRITDDDLDANNRNVSFNKRKNFNSTIVPNIPLQRRLKHEDSDPRLGGQQQQPSWNQRNYKSSINLGNMTRNDSRQDHHPSSQQYNVGGGAVRDSRYLTNTTNVYVNQTNVTFRNRNNNMDRSRTPTSKGRRANNPLL